METTNDIKILKHYWKTPSEIFEVGEIGVDFEPDCRVESGADETIASATFQIFIFEDSGTETTDTMTSGAVDITGLKVSRKVIGGTAGTDYIVRVKATKSGGGVVDGFLALYVRMPDYT